MPLTPATPEDIAEVSRQLGRPARDIVAIAARCVCGNPTVVQTKPRLADGTPFPTVYYLTHPAATAALSTLEAGGLMVQYQDRLAEDAEFAAAGLEAPAWDDSDIPVISIVNAAPTPWELKPDMAYAYGKDGKKTKLNQVAQELAEFEEKLKRERDPEKARAAHTQHGEYLDTLTNSGEFNPSDYAINLTRRPRGLPLWFSLATHGVNAYREAVSKNIEITHFARNEILRRDYLELVREPELSVVVFERVDWNLEQYEEWSKHLLAQNIAFVVPSSHNGRPNARFAIVNPLTSEELITEILDSME